MPATTDSPRTDRPNEDAFTGGMGAAKALSVGLSMIERAMRQGPPTDAERILALANRVRCIVVPDMETPRGQSARDPIREAIENCARVIERHGKTLEAE